MTPAPTDSAPVRPRPPRRAERETTCRRDRPQESNYRAATLLFVLRGAAGLWEQSARPGLYEENQRDQHEDFRQNGAGIRLQQIIDDPHGHPSDERSPQVPDSPEH